MDDWTDDDDPAEPPEPVSSLVPGLAFRSEAGYHLTGRLGAGGMGEVWKADRVSAAGHRHEVALKFVILPDADTRGQLAREALLVSELRHDNIVGFVDSGTTTGGEFFIAMEFVPGVDLDGLLALHGLEPVAVASARARWRIPDPIVGFILYMVGRALHHAHTRRFSTGRTGLVHRDLSPGNVLIEEETGFVKLSDFGVAAAAGADGGGAFAGKFPYAAPEMLMGGAVDARSDIYALGLVAYELLTGFCPNRGLVPGRNAMAQLSDALLAIERPVVSPERVLEGPSPGLGAIVLRMLDPDPQRRHASAEDLMADLRVFLYSKGIGPTADGLRDYLRLLRDPNLPMDELTRKELVFLCEAGREIPCVHRPWRLTAEASARVAAGENPSREP